MKRRLQALLCRLGIHTDAEIASTPAPPELRDPMAMQVTCRCTRCGRVAQSIVSPWDQMGGI